MPLHFQEATASEIAKHIASGIIIRCDEPTDWCSPAFFVPIGDGKRVRLVTDYTMLNQYVVCPVHPFPYVSDILQSMPASAACFSCLLCEIGCHTWVFPNSFGRRGLQATGICVLQWASHHRQTSGVAIPIELRGPPVVPKDCR